MKQDPTLLVRRIKSHHDFMWGYFRDFLESLFRPAMAFLLLLGLSMLAFFATVFYWFEGGGVNANVHDFFDALYFTTSTMTTVGFGDIAPVTKAGRILTMLMMILGTGLFVSYTAIISSAIIRIEQLKYEKEKVSKQI